MLQQTQTERVIQKYEEFIDLFPDFDTLASATLRDILGVWMGLGYNRRAKALKELAERVVTDFGGSLPPRVKDLVTLPGVGRATASAVIAFAFDKPVVFLETNIRRVFLHFFFRGRDDVKDREILPLIEETLDTQNPRDWYYALMDYGVMLKTKYPNANRRSAHYRKQPPFEDSDRRIRGGVLRTLLREGSAAECVIARRLGMGPGRLRKVIKDLEKEGFIRKERKQWTVA
jgi:A/G-specific adenine glycosylase